MPDTLQAGACIFPLFQRSHDHVMQNSQSEPSALYTRIIPPSSCLRVNMGCALVILFQVRPLNVSTKDRSPFTGPFLGVPRVPKSARSILALKLSVNTTVRHDGFHMFPNLLKTVLESHVGFVYKCLTYDLLGIYLKILKHLVPQKCKSPWTIREHMETLLKGIVSVHWSTVI